MALPKPSPADEAPPASAQPEEMFPVVAIGASAGGLEAFTQLISHLPTTTGMAFVLVQHLDPSQPSLLSEIMGRTTEMPVLEVVDGVAIAPNHVYVIPPNQAMTIVAGELRLQPRPRSGSHIIDTFFNALAQERGTKAIGVVLSGANADGTLGLEAIKAAGGITFSQSEASAKFSSMPHMAIATGQVDFIQTPEDIAQTLANLSAHPYITSPSPAEPVAVPQDEASSDTGLSTVLTLLKRATKIDFAQYKPTTVKRRIFRRMALHHLENLESYGQYLQAHPEEMTALHQEILIGVTSFFRDGDVFTALEQTVFPALLRESTPDLPLRIWVAGCSTGQEAYSIAICLLEYMSRHSTSQPIQIFATDVSELAIEIARFGWYSTGHVTDVSPERLQRFFVPTDGGYQVNKVVRELCIFACQNLSADPPFSRLDLISCRNVLIYFGAALQNKVLPMFHYGLKPDGFLLLGSSETAGEFSYLFSLVDSRYKLYAKQSSSLPLSFDFDPTTYTPSSLPPRPDPPRVRIPDIDLYGLADQTVLNRYGPAGVLVNDRLDILQFRGQTGTYLEPAPGRASLNLLTMAKEGLRLDLRTAFYQARQTSQAVQRRSLLIEAGDRPVQIEVVPLSPQPADKAYYLVFFTDLVPDGTAAEVDIPAADLESQYRQENLALQQDLDTTRSHLQSIIQEQEATNQDLRAANEEILSSNEELQSTNEELQTAKEEIQATNEELSTINDELYRRNTETTRISDDFQNLLSSIHIPILMLEDDLRIRRFTPTAATLFNLIPGDVGRPLGNINHRLAVDDLEAHILAVINTLEQSSQEVQDQEGRWYDLRIRPYRTLDNRIDGAVVVLVDIDSLKRSDDKLRQARDYADAIVQTVREALVVLTHDLRVVTANRQFYQTFQVSPGDTEGQLIFELGNGQWNIPQLRSLLHDLLPQNLQVDDFEVVHNFEIIGPQTMRLNARKMTQVNGDDLVLLAIETVLARTANGG
ncbi:MULTISPECIES: chemotaxis protein CheB [Cyanophyceae]|uniref:chemotaxis protein CheB n=1 Tax=Cyanophyceae TaxID=3028117 RepID=UPI00168888DB|nr:MULTISPECIES: chemotaxis protein CheB [Cyanophyceae]MBD1915245.1 PAS domain-containing protein [Phormidium sp. FACHB-77]MBD2032478.1 PAS domain-containing protein [Phormidium sp. FACHB-322]MBD2050991.1 PAS domain-containing protein [Leptolyngbya sp. FACHB-60]